MRLSRNGKDMAGIFAIICGTIYFFGGIMYPLSQGMSEVLWGMAVFFACTRWFTELEVTE